MPQQKFLKTVEWMLLMALFIMVAGFFTWSENILITRIIKVVTRIGMTLGVFFIHQFIVKSGASSQIKFTNVLSPILYVGYLLLGFASFLWSTDPGYSALQWVMDVESLVFAYYFIKSFILLDIYYPGHQVKFSSIMGSTVFGLILIFIVGAFVDQDTFFRLVEGGSDSRLGGYIMNPNELGMLCGVGLSCLIFDLYNKPSKYITVLKILIVLYALILTKSRSSLVGFLLIVFFHVQKSSNWKLKTAVYLAALIAIPVMVQTLMLRSGGIEDILSMTGRMPFWKALISEGLPREPLLGFGFMRIDYTDHFESVHTYAGHMTHNTFLQVLLNLGFIGFTLVLFQMFFTFRGIKLQKSIDKKLLLLGFLIPILINSMTEFGIFGEANFGILFYHLIIFQVSFGKPDRLSKIDALRLKRKRPDFRFVSNA